MKNIIAFLFLVVMHNADAQENQDRSIYINFLIGESDHLSRSSFYENLFSTPSFSLGLGNQHYLIEENLFLDVGVNLSYIRYSNELSFTNPFGTIQSDFKITNLEVIGSLGCEFEYIILTLGLGYYYNLGINTSTKALSNSQLISNSLDFTNLSRFQKRGLISKFGFQYKIDQNTQLELSFRLEFLEGINPINSNGRRYFTLITNSIGVRRLIF